MTTSQGEQLMTSQNSKNALLKLKIFSAIMLMLITYDASALMRALNTA